MGTRCPEKHFGAVSVHSAPRSAEGTRDMGGIFTCVHVRRHKFSSIMFVFPSQCLLWIRYEIVVITSHIRHGVFNVYHFRMPGYHALRWEWQGHTTSRASAFALPAAVCVA